MLAPRVTAPVPFKLKLPRLWMAPTAPPKLVEPVPLFTVKSNVFPAVLSTVALKATGLLLVLSVVAKAKLTAPV